MRETSRYVTQGHSALKDWALKHLALKDWTGGKQTERERSFLNCLVL